MPGVRPELRIMDRRTFESRLTESTNLAVEFARDFVFNLLPSHYRYLLFPNQSYDGNPLVEDEIIFPEESLPQDKYLGPLTGDEVVSYLWRNGKVPEWVDVNVHSVDENYTYLRLLCCGRFTATDTLLYHQHEGRPPFHMRSPYLPPGWGSIEQSSKFDLHWMHETQNGQPNKSFHRARKLARLLSTRFLARR
jgi:hypothetical protein